MFLRSSLKSRASWALGLVAISALVTYGCESTSSFDGSELDADGDGVADDLGKGIDKDGDGKLDDYGAGVAVDTDGDGEADAAGFDTDGDGIIDAIDTDGDGEPDEFTELGDSSGNGAGPGTGSGGGFNIPGASGGGTGTGNGEAEVCDGKDNNDNGIIDDVDAGGDGICDCLNIGTLGTIGPWSSGGNIFADWLNSRSPIPARELDDDELTPEALEGLDVIIALRVDESQLDRAEVSYSDPPTHTYQQSEVDALSAWVENGGGFMTTIGYTNTQAAERENVNRLLAPFGPGYDTPTGLAGDVVVWEDHPISDGVTAIYTHVGVTVDASEGTLVATAPGDQPVLVVYEPGDGHVIVWGDEWITYDSEWEDTEGQQVELFWLNMIKWMSPAERCQVPIPPTILR